MTNVCYSVSHQKVGELVFYLGINDDMQRDFCPELYLFSHLSQKSQNNIHHPEVALLHGYHCVGLA